MGLRGEGGEELWFQSQEGQELGTTAGVGQLILKMSSEHQTVDHRNKLMGNDPDSIFVRFRTGLENKNKQTWKTVLKRPMSFHRPWTRYVYLCSHKFGQKNRTTTCHVRRYAGISVILSKKHGYESIGLGFHQNTMTLDS
jgi:hypothetical protein